MWYKESQSNISLPADRNPRQATKYVRQYNLENRQANHRKYYTIRVYDYEDGNYSVIAYSGRIGGRTPVVQPKGMYRSLSSALDIAQSLARTKINAGYRDQGDFTRTNISVGTPSGEALNPPIPGDRRPRTVTPSSPSSPAQPTRPTDAIFNSTQARSISTPPEQLEAALFNNLLSTNTRLTVAENPSVTSEALGRYVGAFYPTPNSAPLLNSTDESIMLRIARHPNTPSLALDTLLKAYYQRAVHEALSDLFNTSLAVVNNVNTPSSSLRWLIEEEIHNADTPSIMGMVAASSGKIPSIYGTRWRIKFRDKYENGNAKYIEAMISLMGRYGVSEDPAVQQEIADTLLQADYMSLINEGNVGQLIENFVDRLLSSDRFRNILLERFPKTFFDRISMTPQNREVVEQYFGVTQEDSPDMSAMKNLFAKNKNENWYKKAVSVELGKKVELPSKGIIL